MSAQPERQTFIRVAQKPFVLDLVKEAKRVKYTVKTVKDFSYVVTDPEAADALVFRAIQVRPAVWAVSYSKLYWDEPEPVLPATPLNYAKHIHTQPNPQ